MEIIKQGLIETLSDITCLGIVDWNRLNGYWGNDMIRALGILDTWIVGHATYTIVENNLKKYPERNDWPGWEHQGGHEPLGKLYWNMFMTTFEQVGAIEFSDSPDFCGYLSFSEKKSVKIYGDIGTVAISTFIFTLMHMNAGDIWVSVQGIDKQVIIEMHANVGQVFTDTVLDDVFGVKHAAHEKKRGIQPRILPGIASGMPGKKQRTTVAGIQASLWE